MVVKAYAVGAVGSFSLILALCLKRGSAAGAVSFLLIKALCKSLCCAKHHSPLFPCPVSSPAALYKLNFNVLSDFAPLGMVAYFPHLLVTSSQVPANILGLAQNRSSRHGQDCA
jgi:hypothetical protein